MKTNLICASIVLVAGSVLAAPKDDVSAAISKLAAADNYSWKSAPVVDPNAPAGPGGRRGGGFGFFGGGGTVDGKTQKDGLMDVFVPGMAGFGRRGGGGPGGPGGPGGGGPGGGGPDFGGPGGPGGGGPGGPGGFTPQMITNEIVMMGEKGAIKTTNGWQSFAEASAPPADNGDGGGFPNFNPNMMVVNTAQNIKAPAVEAKELLGLVTNVTVADGVYSGTLTEAGAKARLTPGGFPGMGGGEGPEITGAKGSVKFWIKDGTLVKYEYNLQGSMDMMGNPIDMNRTTSVEIKDVGATKIAVPDDAKKKMS